MNCRLLYLIGELGPGGTEQQLCYLLQAMDLEKYKPQVVVWNYREEDVHVPQLRALNVPLHSFPQLPSAAKLRAFRHMVKRLKPEVVHSYSFYTNLAAYWATRGTLTIAIGSVRSNLKGAKKIGLLLGHGNARWPRDQIYNSFAAADIAWHSHRLFVPRRLSVVRNGLDLERFRSLPQPTQEKIRILGVGSLVPIKRWDRLLVAALELKRGGYSFLVQIAGDGRVRRLLEQQAQDLRIADCVEFLGHSNGIPGLLAQATFLVHPSDSEGCPNAVMEAMACGRAVVAMDVGDIPFLIEDGKTGFIVRRGDDSTFIARMATLITNPALCLRMGEAGRVKAEQEFGLERLVLETLAAYRTAGWKDCNYGRPRRKVHIREERESKSVSKMRVPREGVSATMYPLAPALTHIVSQSQDNWCSSVAEAKMKLPILLIGYFLSSSLGIRSVCEDLANRLTASDWRVLTTSSRAGRSLRLCDMAYTVWHRQRHYAIALVDVYSGPAFLWAEAVCWLLRQLGKPYILTLHGGGLPGFARRWQKRVYRLLNSATAVTAPSRYLLENMMPYRADLRLLPNPIAIHAYTFRLRHRPQPSLIWLRSFHAIYNPSLAPRVLARLVQDFPDISLTMIGPDRGDRSLQAMWQVATEAGMGDRIRLPGRIPKADVPDWMSKGDIFLNTTNVDNTPISVLEAMACGLCVVSTNVGGMPYLLEHEHNALLVPADDPTLMAAAVRRLLTEPGLAERLSHNARQKAEQFDWSIILPQWETLLASVAESCVPLAYE